MKILLIILAIAICLCLAAIVYLFYRLQTIANHQKKWINSHAKVLNTQEEQIQALRQELLQLMTNIENMQREFNIRELYGADSSNYYDAIQKAQAGATIEELILDYGLDESEASLIHANYKAKTHDP